MFYLKHLGYNKWKDELHINQLPKVCSYNRNSINSLWLSNVVRWEISINTIYLIEPVFGVDITAKCERDEVEVPTFLTELIQHMEQKALNTEGLYRGRAKAATVETLRAILERGNQY